MLCCGANVLVNESFKPNDSREFERKPETIVTVRRVLLWPPNKLFHELANQRARNLPEVHASLQSFDISSPMSRKPYSSICELGGPQASSFSPINFTDHHFAYYLALEKNIGALEGKMNHALPLRTF